MKTLLYLITGVFVLTVILCWFFYAEPPYKFFWYFISELGATHTKTSGIVNSTSQLIFTIGLITCGVLAIGMAIEYFKPKNVNLLNVFKGISLVVCFFGAITTIFPYDIPDFQNIHRYGAAVFVFALCIYDMLCQFLRFKNRKITSDTGESKKITPDKYYIFFMILVLIGYLIIAALGMVEYQPMAQKIVLFVVVISNIILDKDDF